MITKINLLITVCPYTYLIYYVTYIIYRVGMVLHVPILSIIPGNLILGCGVVYYTPQLTPTTVIVTVPVGVLSLTTL